MPELSSSRQALLHVLLEDAEFRDYVVQNSPLFSVLGIVEDVTLGFPDSNYMTEGTMIIALLNESADIA